MKNRNDWQLSEVADAVDGRLLVSKKTAEALRFQRVTTDSRKDCEEALYVAIVGERFDGHQFAPQAVENGAVAAMVSAPIAGLPAPQIVVNDTKAALGRFAAWHRQKLALEALIGITGSNGKTTTKTLLATVLNYFAPTLATPGNLNNDLGVPRTLLSITPAHHFAVIEMGANHVGEIGYLTGLARPNVAVITNASAAHIEGFGSLENIVKTKGEIFDGLQPGGAGVIPYGLTGSEVWRAKLEHLGHRVITFGEERGADVQVSSFEQKPDQICFDLKVGPSGQTFNLCLPLLGRHNAVNTAAVFAVGLALDLDLRLFPAALQNLSGVAGRLQAQKLKSGVTVIDDSYNANPASIKAGIDTLVAAAQGQKTLLCLGAMAEMGEETEAVHAEIGAYAKQRGVDALLTYGKGAESASTAFGAGAEHFDSHGALSEQAQAFAQQHQPCTILVKGSRSSGMETVAKNIKDMAC